MVLNEQLMSLTDTVRAELSISAAQVLTAAVALEQQSGRKQLRGVIQGACHAVSALDAILHGLGVATATTLPLLQMMSKLLRVLATAADGHCQAALLRACASRVPT